MKKKIIIYFSYSGNTKKIAERIKEKLNYEMLELKPITPFSNNYEELVSYYEHNSEETVDIENINIDLSEYDTIILGTPVWWYTCSPVIRKFLLDNNLEGKTLVPFATNGGWIGHTFEDIKKLTNAHVTNELSIKFNGDTLVTEEKVIDE